MEILQTINRALTDDDIRDILGSDCKIMKYSGLAEYIDLDDLLPKLKDYAIILYEEDENIGHWVGLLKYDNLYEFFDPYGLMPDKQLKWVNLKTRRSLNEATPYLSYMLKQERFIYNHIKYQDLDNFVLTCGSHTVHRIYRLLTNNMWLDDYYKFMKELKEESKFNYDLIVSTFVKSKLN